MADSRPCRTNAGGNISKLINQELGGDDFYSSMYGGFEEEEEDREYETEGSEDDTIDSDFDVDESKWNEPVDGGDDIQLKEKKRKQWIKTYKPRSSPGTTETPKPKKLKSTVTTTTVYTIGYPQQPQQRTFRKSTQKVSKEFKERFEIEEEQHRKRKMHLAKKTKPDRKLTQRELLEEAKQTESENLASLEAYSRLEAEKRKTEKKKVIFSGPVIRFLSCTMPLVTDISKESVNESSNTNITGMSSAASPVRVSAQLRDEHTSNSVTSSQTGADEAMPLTDRQSNDDSLMDLIDESGAQRNVYSRNFMIFTDTNNFPSAYFPAEKPRHPKKRFCPFTGLPAKYVDPLTGTPYGTPAAFKVIRNRYINEGEQKCEKRLLQLSTWLLEKKRKKMEEHP